MTRLSIPVGATDSSTVEPHAHQPYAQGVELPGVDRAVVDPAKIRDYLLSTSHPVGRFKARFFFGLGFGQENWQALTAELLRHAESEEVAEGENSTYGRKFEVRGKLSGPTGRAAGIVAVWIVLADEDFPRFITAFPS